MSTQTGKRTANLKVTLNKRNVESLKPADKPFIAWDDKLTGFGLRVQPSGVRAYIVNYRVGTGGRRATNRRLVIGRHGRVTADQARRLAQETLGRVAGGDDPATERALGRTVPTLREAFDEFLAAGPKRKESTVAVYRCTVYRSLGAWIDRTLDTIDRRDVEKCFLRLTNEAGWAQANSAMNMLRMLYRRHCIDIQGLHNPVDQWRAAGGRPHRPRRRTIQPPAEVLPRWHRGIETVVRNPVARDAFRFGLYTGMRKAEVSGLEWARIDLDEMTFRVEETKTGEPLELPVTRRLVTILQRRFAERSRGWVFPSGSAESGHMNDGMHYLNARISEAGRQLDHGAASRRRPTRCGSHRRVNSCVCADAGGNHAGGEGGNRPRGSIAGLVQDSGRESAVGVNTDILKVTGRTAVMSWRGRSGKRPMSGRFPPIAFTVFGVWSLSRAGSSTRPALPARPSSIRHSVEGRGRGHVTGRRPRVA